MRSATVLAVMVFALLTGAVRAQETRFFVNSQERETWLIATNEIMAPLSLIDKLRSYSEPLSEYLWDRFSQGAQFSLISAAVSREQKTQILSEQLNSILLSRSIYRSELFFGMEFSELTEDLIANEPDGAARVRLNRLLLEQRYPEEISPSELSKIIIADARPADPYPSVIQTDGMPGVVSKVVVKLYGLQHGFPDDIDILLVSPSGEKCLLMSDAGGGFDLNEVILTLDESADLSLPDNAPIATGSYRPTNFDPGGASDVIFSPAPPGPYRATTSELYGAPPNGQWSLFVLDDAGSDEGVIWDGWSLTLSTIEPESVADLALTVVDIKDPIPADAKLVYRLSVTNQGPFDARGVVVKSDLARDTEFLFATPSLGTCGLTNGEVICQLGALRFEESASILIGMIPSGPGVFTNKFEVFSETGDFNLDNSAAMEVTTVVPSQTADLAVFGSSQPDPVIVFRELTYNVTVTNQGPLNATGVVLVNTLSPTMTYLSSSPSQGSCNLSGNNVICSLGALSNGAVATVTIRVNPSVTGFITNVSSVTANEFDTSPGNSTVAIGTLVYQPTDLSVQQIDSQDPAAIGSNLTYTVSVRNNGPGYATGVILSNRLPISVNYLGASASQGSCQLINGELVRCNLGNLPPRSAAQVYITVQPLVLGAYYNSAQVSSLESDPNLGNNSSLERTTVFPGGDGIVITPSTNALELANAITSAGSTGIRVTGAQLQAQDIPTITYCFPSGYGTNICFDFPGGVSSGLYSVVNPPYTYGLEGLGVIISSGSVLDYGNGPNFTSGNSTGFGVAATTNQEALLDPITASGSRSFQHFDVTQLDVQFDMLPGFDTVQFNVVFGSEEYPEFVNSSFIDGFGIYLNGVNIAYTKSKPININHSDMRALTGTELDGVLAPDGNAILTFTKFLGEGLTDNRLTFIVCDTSDSALDTTVYVSSLQGVVPQNADLAVSLTGPTNHVTVGSNAVYWVSVTNLGPDLATGVVLSNNLPPGMAFLSAVPDQGNCVLVGGTVICDLGSIDASYAVEVKIVGAPMSDGPITNFASVGALVPDFVNKNNTAASGTLALQYGAYIYTDAIRVNDAAPASPYPAAIEVSGLAGVVTKATVTLLNLSHSFPADLDVLLVSPSGRTVLLMSDAGGNLSLVNANLTFKDDAYVYLPKEGINNSGEYRPTDYEPADLFIEPAPMAPYQSALSAFVGENPNGIWSLYVYDDSGSDDGLIFGGWKLALQIESWPDLQVRQEGSQIWISWPAEFDNFELESKQQLSAGTDWTKVSATPVLAAGRYTVSIENPLATGFYRLKKIVPR